MVVDAHLHLGPDLIWDVENNELELLTQMDANGIDAACIMPQNGEPTIAWARAQHDRIAAFAAEQPGRVFGLANVHVYSNFNAYADEVTRAIHELGFVGVKIQAFQNGPNPLGRRIRQVFELLQGLDVPVMVHTGVGMPAANPAMWILPAREFPHLKVVMAHCGHGVLAGEVSVAASVCDNIFMETSSTGSKTIAGYIKRFGAERVMFGSDSELLLREEMFRWQSLPISEAEREQCLSKTATAVFRLPPGVGRQPSSAPDAAE